MNSSSSRNVVILGATGAVGSEAMRELALMDEIAKVTVLTRRPFTAVQSDKFVEHIVDPLDPQTYAHLLVGHEIAICTLGVGAVSSVSKEDFLRVDRDAVIAYGEACKAAGVLHFELLSSIAVNPKSKSFFLRSKGQLEDALKAMRFERLSLFHPSMILTPNNRYGVGQAITLAVWPKLAPILSGPLRHMRGVKVATLGAAFARNLTEIGEPVEILEWDDFQRLTR
ncbi:MAG: NAD(P)H-binding protein [Cognatishimia sp.]|uniref:NAD(P)H-binding protein n=1 Tax=Cognatishimia sp. TaxID=2211648 RepID=UPI003B8B4BC6